MAVLTPPEHEHSHRIDEAVHHYHENRDSFPRPIIPHLRRMFDLTPIEAVQVIREAQILRTNGGAHDGS